MIEEYKYSPEAPLDCHITVFGGLKDHMVKRSGIGSMAGAKLPADSSYEVRGNHLFLKIAQDQLLHSVAGEMNLSQNHPTYELLKGNENLSLCHIFP